MNAAAKYSVWRLLIFLVVFLLLCLIPPVRENPIVLVLAAGTISMIASLVLLTKQREAMALEVQQRVEGRLERKQGSRAYQDGLTAEEDAEIDGYASSTPPTEHNGR